MSNSLEELDKTLGILDVEYTPRVKAPDDFKRSPVMKMPAQELVDTGQVSPVVDMSEDVDNDYAYQRQNFYNLVERGNDAIEGILELAKESEHPRTYEVAGNLIKQVSEVTEKLGDLQEKMRKLKEVPNNAPKNVTNALFVGSTAELQKMLKDS